MANDSNPVSFAWVEYDPRALKERRELGVYNQQRRVVRAHVAHTSSGVRKATIARKESIAKTQGSRKSSKSGKSSKKQDKPVEDFITLLFARLRSRDASAVASMAQKSDRTLLWNAFTGGSTCFEAALFVAGTFANTCGISRHDLHTGFGSGLLFLRGASLDGIQKTIIHTPKDSLNSISIALLAGWERRFGDEQSYAVHLQAWKALPLSMGSLEDSSIAALADVALICFQEAAQERYIAESAFSAARSLVYGTVLPQGLPRGYHIIPTERPEVLSLLGTVAKCAMFNWKAPGSVESFRRLILETLSWSASHSISTEPVDSYEEAWDQTDLLALYHVRSAMVSANAPIMWACIEAHNLRWAYDVQTGIDIHAEACRHLRSHELMGTKYEEIAIWAKMTMVSHATPTADGDEHMSGLMKYSSIKTWEQMEALLRRHVFREELAWQKYRSLFDRLVY
ncbi:hypothetical protein D6D10_05542 [Aureobasidium pullulans]|uniref:Uncharacterized protein n=1 Tax=Aureobasidium pullulans TaxID=5580 RepID=A0A4S9ESV9_AURPU|nr:hypothetical protein D6D10_05542 [Aureobasidium pullulans]